MNKIKFEPYKFQNIYLITTYRCNWECDFCLFRYNEEEEAPIEVIVDRLRYSIEDSEKKVYIKITGGEPFIKTELLRAVFELVKEYPDKIYKVGIGTNGSIRLPNHFNDITVRTHIFLSRHDMVDEHLTPSELSTNVQNPLIDFRINCNLIKGGVDSVAKIEAYIKEKYSKTGVTHFCFRELSKVDVDKNLIYPGQIYQYVDYYDSHFVAISKLEPDIKFSSQMQYSRHTGNYYDRNYWYWYQLGDQKISVKFRSIDETKLIEFNEFLNLSIDEYVIHPDGTLTGCWDKDLKLIKEGYYAE